MKATNIQQILENGGQLIYKNNGFCPDRYFISDGTVHNRINQTQFEKFKVKCKNADATQKQCAFFNGQGYRIFYWL